MCTVLLLRVNALPLSNSLGIEKKSYPDVTSTYHPRDSTKIAVCASCKKPKSLPRKKPSSIYSFVHSNSPIQKRKYLSPVYLYSSLGRTVDANAFSEYRCRYKKPTNSQLLSYTNNHDHLTLPTIKSSSLAAGIVETQPKRQQDKWSLEYLYHSTRATRPPQTPLMNAAFSAHTTPPNAHISFPNAHISQRTC